MVLVDCKFVNNFIQMDTTTSTDNSTITTKANDSPLGIPKSPSFHFGLDLLAFDRQITGSNLQCQPIHNFSFDSLSHIPDIYMSQLPLIQSILNFYSVIFLFLMVAFDWCIILNIEM